mgnify:CR=1 FL=1
MSFNDYQKNVSRKPIQLIILELDYCSLTFGVSPCLATGIKCYNTFATCKYKQAFTKSIKEYHYVNNYASIETIQQLDAKPYIANVQFMPTELSEDKTIPARCKIELYDEYDTDIGIDKYVNDRVNNILDIQGTHFKKLIERNPNYRGRYIKIYEGYEGLDFSEYKQRAILKIDNIKRDKNKITIECIDLLKALDEIKYPIRLSAKILEDFGAAFPCKNENEMLQLTAKTNDYAVRTDFIYLVTNISQGTNGYLDTGEYIYTVIAYDNENNAFARSNDFLFTVDSNEDITLDWSLFHLYNSSGIAYYRVFRTFNGITNYLQTTNTLIYDNGVITFPNSGNPETEAYRIFELIGPEPTHINNWQEITDSISLTLNDTSQLTAPGYFKIEDEIIYFRAKDANKVYGIKRLQFNTKAETKHYANTNIYAIIWFNPGNPFNHLLTILNLANYSDDRIELTKINAYKNSYSGINFSIKPIIKETDAGKLVFDLIRILDGKLWVNENGKIDFKYNSEITPSCTITDADNIIINSTSIDYEQDIKTRIVCYYDLFDPAKGISSKENYQKVNVTIDADAESEFEYNEKLTEEITTIWINSDCGTQAQIDNYLNNILKQKLKRLRNLRPKLQFDLELKDSDIAVGDIISLQSDEFNNIDGTNYNGKLFEVIKKDPKFNKITFLVQLIPTTEIFTQNDNQIQILETPKPVSKFYVPEVKVTGLKFLDNYNNEHSGMSLDIEAENVIKLIWDNMYMSQATTATDINGITRSLPLIWVYTGYPPVPHHQVYDLSSWKSVKNYKIYMFVADIGKKYSAAGRPSQNDANGKWYLIGIVRDNKILNAAKKYQFTYPIPLSLCGRYLSFDVYAEANIEYDPLAPIGIDLPVLK